MVEESQLLAHLGPGQFVPLLHQIARKGRGRAAFASSSLSSLTRKQLLEVCAAIRSHVEVAVQQLSAEPDDDDEQGAIVKLDSALAVLRGAALLTHDVLQQCRAQPPESLQQAAALLHDNGLLVLGTYPDVQDAVARLCCSWWEHQAPGLEGVAAQTLPYLLVRTLELGRHTDVKQCFALRGTLQLFDFDDASIADTKRMLLQAAMHPAFLHRTEGRRFLASLHNLHTSLVLDLAAVICNQAVSGRKSVLDAYGDVVLRAWRGATGACQHEVEHSCIQPLMEAAIRARSPALAANLRAVLAPLHAAKREAGVDALLLRLYEPILFRALSAANAQVRRNALLLLVDAFPLTDPQQDEVDTDELLTRQFVALRDCLLDACPVIRADAVASVCKLLSLYWEIIPAATAALLVSKLTAELAHDAAAPAVRAAVLDGLRLLVDSPHAQPVLKKAMRGLSSLLGDASLRVREAMAALLVSVSRCRGVHFWEVVPLEQLLDCLAGDVPSVSAQVQSLLVPSYFPSPEEGSLCVAKLLKSKPAAGQAFCRYLAGTFRAGGALQLVPSAVPVEHLLQLAAGLRSHLLATCAQLAAASQSSPGQPSRKASRKLTGTRSRAGTQPKGITGKRRKALTANALLASDSEDGAGTGGQQGAPARNSAVGVIEEDEMVDDAGETPSSWTSIAAGLAEVCRSLAGAAALEQCTPEDVEAVFEEDSLLLMMEAAPGADARAYVLTIATLLSGTGAAAALRSHLLSRLAAGDSPLALCSLAVDGASPSHAQTAGGSAAAAEMAAEQLSQLGLAVGCICAGGEAPKLVALLLQALGARPQVPVHVPVNVKGTTHAASRRTPDVEAAYCIACGAAEPEDTLLLCDGCEVACHLHCFVPAMPAVPTGDWLCHGCEEDVRGSRLRPLDAVRLVEAMLSLPAGRELLHSHGHFPILMDGLRCQATACLGALLRGCATPGSDPATAASYQEEVGAIAQAEVNDGAATAARVFCKAALHAGLMPILAGGGGEDDGIAGVAGTSAEAEAATHLMAIELQRGMGLWRGAVAPSSGAPAEVQRLRVAAAVLGVLCDAQQLRVLDLSRQRGDQLLQLGAAAECTVALCADVAVAAAAVEEDEGNDMPGNDNIAVAQGATRLVIALAEHLAASPSMGAAAQPDTAPGSKRRLSQQLEQLLETVAVGEPAGTPCASGLTAGARLRAVLGGVATALLHQMTRQGAQVLARAVHSDLGTLLSKLLLLSPAAATAVAVGSRSGGAPAVDAAGWQTQLCSELGAAVASGAASVVWHAAHGTAGAPGTTTADSAELDRSSSRSAAGGADEDRRPHQGRTEEGKRGGAPVSTGMQQPCAVLSHKGGAGQKAVAQACLLVSAFAESHTSLATAVAAFTKVAADSWRTGDQDTCCGAASVLCLLSSPAPAMGRRRGGPGGTAVGRQGGAVTAQALRPLLEGVTSDVAAARAGGRKPAPVQEQLQLLLQQVMQSV